MNRLVSFVEENEQRMISYRVYLNQENTEVTVLQIHPDNASAENHMKVGASAFPGVRESYPDGSDRYLRKAEPNPGRAVEDQGFDAG
jgi:hypothetical protein